MSLGPVELAFRVLAGLFVILAPTILFLALWRGLEAMRDDELIERARRRADATEQSPGGSDWPIDPIPGGERSVHGDAVADERVACAACGTPNIRDVTYCRECLEPLPDE